MKRIRHIIKFIKSSSIIVYINYLTTIFIFKQTILTIINIDKLNLRLIQVSQYFFNFNFVIQRKTKKFNIILNVLSRLFNVTQLDVKNKIEILNALYNYSINFSKSELRFVTLQNTLTIVYYVILIKISNKFKQCFKTIYINNLQ